MIVSIHIDLCKSSLMIIQLNPSKSEAYDQVISYHNLKIKTTE